MMPVRIRYAQQRILASQWHKVKVAEIRERHAEMGADCFQPKVKFAFIVLGVGVNHGPRFGQPAEPVTGENVRAGKLQDQDAFSIPPSPLSKVTARRIMRSRTAQSRAGTGTPFHAVTSSMGRGLSCSRRGLRLCAARLWRWRLVMSVVAAVGTERNDACRLA